MHISHILVSAVNVQNCSRDVLHFTQCTTVTGIQWSLLFTQHITSINTTADRTLSVVLMCNILLLYTPPPLFDSVYSLEVMIDMLSGLVYLCYVDPVSMQIWQINKTELKLNWTLFSTAPESNFYASKNMDTFFLLSTLSGFLKATQLLSSSALSSFHTVHVEIFLLLLLNCWVLLLIL